MEDPAVCRVVAKAPLAASSHLVWRGWSTRSMRAGPWLSSATRPACAATGDETGDRSRRRDERWACVTGQDRRKIWQGIEIGAGCRGPESPGWRRRDPAMTGAKETLRPIGPLAGHPPPAAYVLDAMTLNGIATDGRRCKSAVTVTPGSRGRDRNPSGPRRRTSRRLGRAARTVHGSTIQSIAAR